MSVSNAAVCHAWAHGNSKQGGNISTDGKRLISYSTDVAYNTGRGLVFISNDNMSLSTGKQLSYARRAVSHLDVVYTPIFKYGSRFYDFDEKQAFKMACDALNKQLEGYSIAKLSKYLSSSIDRSLAEAGRLETLADKYGYSKPVWVGVDYEKIKAARVYAEQYEGKEQERRAAKQVKEYARQAAQRELQSAQFELWHNGGMGACPYSFRNDAQGGYYIAVRGDKVVTSGGAECPIEHARLAIKFWRSRLICNDVETTFTAWHRNGHRVQLGAFQLDRIEADGTAYAGCHKFNAAELQRLAQVLL